MAMQRLLVQFAKFGIVGLVATLIDGLTYVAIVSLGGHYQVANAIAFVVSIVFNYYASMKYVFVSKYAADERHKEILWFVALSFSGYVVSVGLLALFVGQVHLPANVSKGIAMIAVIVWNFVTRKLFLEKE